MAEIKRRNGRSWVYLIFVWIVIIALPGVVYAQEEEEGLTIISADGETSVTFSGQFQLRYVVEIDDFEPQHNSFL